MGAAVCPKVSVVMTVYRPDRRYFPQAVDSILNQSFRDFEFIIVEDPSDVAGCELLTPEQLARIHYVSNAKRTSLISQKNLAIEIAAGEYVAMMDADDLSDPRRLERQAGYLDLHPEIDLVGSQIVVMDVNNQPCGLRSYPLTHPDIVRVASRIVPFCHPTIMVRRNRLVDVGGYHEFGYKTAEDYELYSRLLAEGAGFANLAERLLWYRVHPQQMKFLHIRDTVRAVVQVKKMYWRKRMGIRSRMRMWAEQCLLSLPDSLVYQLAVRALYTEKPGQCHAPPSLPDWPAPADTQLQGVTT